MAPYYSKQFWWLAEPEILLRFAINLSIGHPVMDGCSVLHFLAKKLYAVEIERMKLQEMHKWQSTIEILTQISEIQMC